MAKFSIAGGNEKDTIVFEDTEIQEILSLCGEGDRVGVAEELTKRFLDKRPNDTVHIHVWETNPFRASAMLGQVPDDWWEEMK